jgi:hypothetical protein
MATFRKFAFPDGDTADKLLREFLQPLDFAVPLGHLCAASDEEGNCIKTRPEFAVDILFNDTCPEPLAAFVVWPAPLACIRSADGTTNTPPITKNLQHNHKSNISNHGPI